MTDKYSGYAHPIAHILRGFEEWAAEHVKSYPSNDNPQYNEWHKEGIYTAQARLTELADAAQREIDECKAAQEK